MIYKNIKCKKIVGNVCNILNHLYTIVIIIFHK